MPYLIALLSLRPSIALNPKLIAFISVIFVASAGFCLWSWLHRLPHVFMSLFSNFLFVFCDLVYLINLI